LISGDLPGRSERHAVRVQRGRLRRHTDMERGRTDIRRLVQRWVLLCFWTWTPLLLVISCTWLTALWSHLTVVTCPAFSSGTPCVCEAGHLSTLSWNSSTQSYTGGCSCPSGAACVCPAGFFCACFCVCFVSLVGEERDFEFLSLSLSLSLSHTLSLSVCCKLLCLSVCVCICVFVCVCMCSAFAIDFWLASLYLTHFLYFQSFSRCRLPPPGPLRTPP
jgi:hypothetical protein